MKTPHARLARYIRPELNFICVSDFQHYVRKYDSAPDYVAINSQLFTMDMYDMDGKTLTYQNRRNNLELEIETANRYGETAYSDAKVSMDLSSFYRTDIVYAD